jgi:AraC-like DNA-binding protein
MPGSEHVIEYHVVTRGHCYAGLVGEPPILLSQGDVVVFPQGDAHIVSSAPGMRGEPASPRRPEQGQLPIAMSIGGQGAAETEIVCGFLGCDANPFNPLLATLPRMLHVPQPPNTENHLSQLVRFAVIESAARGPGSEGTLSRLSELLFIEIVRRYILSLPHDTTGWLAGLRDDGIGRALACLHDRPSYSWSLDELAREVGLSRSILADRFHHFVGVPPMQYLARWRMQLAASLLSGGAATLSDIAARVGYGSEAALSRAFKRYVGVAPSSWREGERPASAVVAPPDGWELTAGTADA